MRAIWIFPALLLTLSGCVRHLNEPQSPAATPLPEERPFIVLEDQRYSPPGWPQPLFADVYLPDTPNMATRPVALLVHGGGWQGRTPEDMAPIAEHLAQRGFVAVNIGYRFAPEYKFPAQIHDLQQAMHWIHRQADEWRIDTSRIAGVGYSSGAHLVSLLAVVAGQGGEVDRPYGGERTRLDAVIAGGTPTNLFKFDDGRLVVEFLGGTRLEVPLQYANASPMKHIHPQVPPFFLFHGTWDDLVPPDHAKDFYHALREQGIYSELYLLRYRGHITTFLTRYNAIEAGIDFLARQLEQDQG